MHVDVWVWVLFASLVLAMLALDLGMSRRQDGQAGEVTVRSAAKWSAAWIGLGLSFGLIVLALYGHDSALAYLTAYLLEKSLSVDNIFVFVLVFSELQIPFTEQRRVLYWGVIGALLMRGLLIAAGIFLLERFQWVIYPFAVLVMMVLALPFAYYQQRAGGVGGKVFAGIMLGIGFWMLGRLFTFLGLLRDWPPFWSAILPTLMFLSLAVIMMWWGERR